MGFKDKNGKKLSENDISSLKQIYTDLFEGYLKVIVEPDPISFGDKYDDPAVEHFQNVCNDFLNKFDEKSRNTDEDFVVEDFYNTELNNLFNDYAGFGNSPENLRNGYYQHFFKKFRDHFISRFDGSVARNGDEGLASTMSGFSLTKEPLEDIEKIAEYDPNVQGEDPFIEARLSNSGTYAQLQIDDNKELLNKAISEFKTLSDYTRSVAASLQKKESVEFSDLYNVFTQLNRELRPGETDGGKIRVDEIGFGNNLEGIGSCAIPADLFTTLNRVADYMNEIKKTEDPLVRKSQAVQLAAFAYQLTVSEHIFGNGNGRSCRLLCDTILQTFGLPPQVPTFDLISTGGEIGSKLDFNRGAKCFTRGLVLATDLKNLNENKALESKNPELDKNTGKALAYLNSEHLSSKLLEVTSPSNAINLAIQSGEVRYGLVENLKDFINANHFGTRDSKQYKALIDTAWKSINTLSLNSIYSKKSEKALNDLSTAIENYEAHCQRHPKNNKTRRSRLNAVMHMKESIENAKDVSVLITDIESVGFKKDLNANNEIIANYMTDEMLNEVKNGAGINKENQNRKYIGQYVLRKLVIKQVDSIKRTINFEEAKEYSEDEKQLNYILEGNTLEKAIEAAGKNESLSGKTMQEKLDQISEDYFKLKVSELAKQPKPEQETLQKNNKQKDIAAAPEEKSIMSYMKE